MLGITDSQWYQGIADKIRTYMPSFKKSKPSELPQAVENLFIYGTQMGQEAGYQTGYDFGLEVGKQAEYDQFWDVYMMNGNQKSFTCLFAGTGWREGTFKPKYDIVPTSAASMFTHAAINTDLVELLASMGITLDLSQCSSMNSCFAYSQFVRLGVIDTRNANSLGSLFTGCSSLETIDLLLLKEDGSQTLTSVLSYCGELKNLEIEGVIGQNGFNVQWSNKLTHDSLMSIINALQDKSADTSGTEWVVTIGTTNLAKLTDAEKAIATQKGWSLA